MPTLFRAEVIGELGTDAEVFAYGMWLAVSAGDPSAAEVAPIVVEAVSAFLAHAPSGSLSSRAHVAEFFAPEVAWTQAAVRAYTPTTGAPLGDGFERSPITSEAGTNTGKSLPYQDALAVTLDRGGLGRKRWNRFYLPPLAMDGGLFSSGGIINADCAQSIVNATVAFDTALDAGFATLGLCHYSPTDHVVTLRPEVEVGNVMDTQRRRRNNLSEARTFVNLT